MGMHIDLHSESPSAEFLRGVIPRSSVMTCRNASKKAGALQRYIAGAAGSKLSFSHSPPRNLSRSYVWLQIMPEACSMLGGDLLRAYKYHMRKARQPIIFRFRTEAALEKSKQ